MSKETTAPRLSDSQIKAFAAYFRAGYFAAQANPTPGEKEMTTITKPTDTTTAPEWITREAAAEILTVNVRTIDRYIREKRIKTKRPKMIKGRGGIRILVRRSDVDAIANYDPTQE